MSDYLSQALDRIAAGSPWPYSTNGQPATEPTALGALALIGHDRREAARPALAWLANLQAGDGSLGVSAKEASPCWPTGLAVLAWAHAGTAYFSRIERAMAWILEAHGKAQPRTPQLGHDSTLVGWSWAAATHSWVEPTALNVLALKATRRGNHPRTREAVRLVFDRLLPTGGCNYGNTTVLGQQLNPQLLPTGLAMLALAGEEVPDDRLAKSLDYLERELSHRTPCASLCYGMMGLAAHGRFPQQGHQWLAAAAEHVEQRGVGEWKLALIALAALGERCPLLQQSAKGA